MNSVIKSLLPLLLAFSCHTPQKNFPSKFDLGVIEKNVYTNEFFDMRLEFPPDWHLIGSEEMDANRKMAMQDRVQNDRMMRNNKYAQNMIETTMNNSASLLSVYKYKTEDEFVLYPSFIMSALNIKGDGLDQTAKGYLYDLRRAKEVQLDEDEVAEDFYWKNIGNEKYDAVWWINYGVDPPIMHEAFARKKNDILLFVFLTYSTLEEKGELYDILERATKFELK